MKKLPSVKAKWAIITILLLGNICTVRTLEGPKSINDSDAIIPTNTLGKNISNNRLINIEEENKILAMNGNKYLEDEVIIEEPKAVIVYDGMTLDELSKKLEKNLKSTLKGYGKVFAEAAIKYDVNPYLGLAIVLHETGCSSGNCSTLTKKCNNVGGMKGSSRCNGTSYAKFSSLNAGIDAFFKNLSKNYIKKGLTTPEKIGKKYAESSTWASKVKYFMNKIKNS